MRRFKIFLLFFVIIFGFSFKSNSQSTPGSFADLAERLMPSVVNISTTTTITTKSNPFPFQFPPGSPFEDMFREFGAPEERKSAALGSGFIIDKKGIVVTNNHVISDAEDIIVRVNGDKEFKAKVVGADPLSDIAVLQLETKEKFIPVKFGDSDKARIGDWVIAIGNPFGLGGTVTSGIISARNRSIGLSRYEDYIQTDASINSGNSGGPLFDMNGDVIGINTAILGRNGSIGIGFSIPSNSAKIVIDQLIEFGETKRGWLGVRIQDVTKEIAEIEKLNEPIGALVASVAEGSPSDKAGIKAGDIIISNVPGGEAIGGAMKFGGGVLKNVPGLVSGAASLGTRAVELAGIGGATVLDRAAHDTLRSGAYARDLYNYAGGEVPTLGEIKDFHGNVLVPSGKRMAGAVMGTIHHLHLESQELDDKIPLATSVLHLTLVLPNKKEDL